jgi:hypothetical protein
LPTSSSAAPICWSIMRTELSISAILADHLALAEHRVLRFALGLLRAHALLRQRAFRPRHSRAHRLRSCSWRADFLSDARQRRAPRRAARRPARLRADDADFVADLRGAFLVALQRLAELERLDLGGVLVLLLRGQRVARLLQRRGRSASCASMRGPLRRRGARRAAPAICSALPALSISAWRARMPASAGSGAWKLPCGG